MNKYKITDITDLNDQTRTDGRYPNRIGSIINLDNNFLKIGECLYLDYLQDNKGNNKEGVLRTSKIQGYCRTDDNKQIEVYTLNSTYYLERWGENENI